MELSSTLELPRPHAEGDGIRDTYPASQHRLRLFSRACLETPRWLLGSDPVVGSKITIAVEETRADPPLPPAEILHQRTAIGTAEFAGTESTATEFSLPSDSRIPRCDISLLRFCVALHPGRSIPFSFA